MRCFLQRGNIQPGNTTGRVGKKELATNRFMQKNPWRPDRKVISIYLLASAAGLLLTILLSALHAEPSDVPVLFGLSGQRLVMLGGMFVVAVGLTILGLLVRSGVVQIQFLYEKKHRNVNNVFILVVALLFLVAWALLWIPSERFGEMAPYHLRFYTFIIWLACASGIALALLLAIRSGIWIIQFKEYLKQQRSIFLAAGICLIVFGLVAWGSSQRVVGMTGEEDFWYGAGVPVLVTQVLVALVVSFLFSLFWKKISGNQNSRNALRADRVIFIAIWLLAAFLWIEQPIRPDFIISKPTAPNFELYPDYDGKFYDVTSQYALIGQELNNGDFYDRILYPAFLFYLHMLGGQDYQTVMAIQAGILAVFPALIYLLGKHLYSRPVGMGLAILFTLRGLNSMELGGVIDTAHQKHMMTDFPTAVMILLASLLMVKWVQSKGSRWTYAGFAAGTLGLTTLLRPHAMGLVALLLLLVFIVYRKRARLWVGFSVLVVTVMVASVLPWSQFGGHNASINELYFERILNTIRQRYPDFPLPGEDSSIPTMRTSAHPTRARIVFQEQKSMTDFVLDNFLNNLVTAAQTLPSTPYWFDLRTMVKESENYWKPYWDGELSLWGRFFLPLNLGLVALGIAVAWKRARLSGLIPLFVMLLFFGMNALARTSGGRYLVPVDWALILYYFLGLMLLWEMAAAFFGKALFVVESLQAERDAYPSFGRKAILQIAGIVLLFGGLGSLLPLTGSFFEQRYPPVTQKILWQHFIAQPGALSGVTGADIKAFFSHPNAQVLQGRILYPRFFERLSGYEASMFDYYRPRIYPRMVLTLLGPQGETSVILPVSEVPRLPNASDAIILACREGDHVQAWAIWLTAENRIIKRDPAAPLSCPLREPVCDNNRNCQ